MLQKILRIENLPYQKTGSSFRSSNLFEYNNKNRLHSKKAPVLICILTQSHWRWGAQCTRQARVGTRKRDVVPVYREEDLRVLNLNIVRFSTLVATWHWDADLFLFPCTLRGLQEMHRRVKGWCDLLAHIHATIVITINRKSHVVYITFCTDSRKEEHSSAAARFSFANSCDELPALILLWVGAISNFRMD